ncbi:MAG: hypothetical protein MUF24_03315 [Chitinophagaceae bacterium]|jgi:hypothetical protein|nr:hypothetical protein [Chitinophagaceae bacterium]
MAKIDDDIKQLAGGYSHEPERDLWPGIAAALDRKDRRRPVLWWWLGAAALLLGGGLWWWLPQAGSRQQVATTLPPVKVAPAAPVQTEPTLGQKAGNGLAATNHKGVNNTKVTGPQNLKPATDIAANTPAGEKRTATKSRKQRTLQNGLPAHTALPEQKPEGQASVAFDEVNATLKHNKFTPTTHDTTALSEAALAQVLKGAPPPGHSTWAQADSVLPVSANNLQARAVPAPVALPKADTAVAATGSPAAAVAKKPMGKPQWRLAAGTGMHNLAGSRLLQWQQSAYEFNVSLPTGNLNSGAVTPGAIMVPNKPGAGFTLGVERLQPVSATSSLSWSAGVLYQYQRLRQYSGMQQANNGLVQTDRVALPFYFSPGDTVSLGGSQQRLQLMAGLHWQPGRHKRWEVAGRLYGGAVLAHRYLMPLGRQAGWLPSQQVAAPAYAGLEAMVGYRIGKVQLSVAVSQNLTRAARFNFLPAQYWRSIDLRIAVPFYFSKKAK